LKVLLAVLPLEGATLEKEGRRTADGRKWKRDGGTADRTAVNDGKKEGRERRNGRK
jgi:hypothetical protein